MFEVIVLCTLALIWIIVATVQDIKMREVANWINFSLIIFALGFRFFYSLFAEASFMFFYQGLIGLAIFFALGNIFYYSRMFAGGDAKLLIALGAILPFSESFFSNLKIFALFFFVFLIVGAIYGLIWSTVLVIKNFKEFKKQFLNHHIKYKNKIYLVMFFGILCMFLGFIETLFFLTGVLIFILPYFYIYAKAIDEACMVKKIKTKDLREGDWLYKNTKIKNKIIKANWDGLTKEQIKLIQKYKKQIKIKQGIPFVPVFLISFAILITLYFLEFSFSFF